MVSRCASIMDVRRVKVLSTVHVSSQVVLICGDRVVRPLHFQNRWSCAPASLCESLCFDQHVVALLPSCRASWWRSLLFVSDSPRGRTKRTAASEDGWSAHSRVLLLFSSSFVTLTVMPSWVHVFTRAHTFDHVMQLLVLLALNIL